MVEYLAWESTGISSTSTRYATAVKTVSGLGKQHTEAMDAVNVDLDEMRARVDATHSIITSRQRVEATMTAEISTMRLDIGDIQEALKNHDSWMEDVSNTLQQMQEKEENLSEDMINLKNVWALQNCYFVASDGRRSTCIPITVTVPSNAWVWTESRQSNLWMCCCH